MLILASRAPDAGVVAYDRRTGDVKWKTPNLGNESYASPSVVKIDGEDHIVMVISSTNPIGHRDLPQTLGNVVGIEPLTGKILWNYDKWKCHISVPSAVDAGQNRVLVVGGYELGATMLKVEKKTDGSYGTTELFKTEEFGDQTKPPILHNGCFYAQYGTNRRRDGLVCMSMDGQMMWKTRRDANEVRQGRSVILRHTPTNQSQEKIMKALVTVIAAAVMKAGPWSVWTSRRATSCGTSVRQPGVGRRAHWLLQTGDSTTVWRTASCS